MLNQKVEKNGLKWLEMHFKNSTPFFMDSPTGLYFALNIMSYCEYEDFMMSTVNMGLSVSPKLNNILLTV